MKLVKENLCWHFMRIWISELEGWVLLQVSLQEMIKKEMGEDFLTDMDAGKIWRTIENTYLGLSRGINR